MFGSLFLITSALGVKYTYSNQLWDGTAKSTCSTCGMLSSDQFTYGSNWGTWYLSQNSIFPITLKVNDMFNEQSIDDVYSKYMVQLRDKNTDALIKDYTGNFENAGYMESTTIYYNYTVTKETSVVARVYLSRNGGLSWEESYYYQTGTSPTWTFKYQPTSVADIDKDGKPDADDLCPTLPETVNGYLDADGCPDSVPVYTPGSTSGGTTTTIIPVTTTPSSSSTPSTGTPVTEPDATDDGNDVGGGDDDDEPAPVQNYDMFEGSCSTWANNTLLGLGEWFPSVLGPFTFMLTLLCWVSRVAFMISIFPFVIVANLHYAFSGILCLGAYEGLVANALPLIVIGLFLLTCLVPDDIVSAVMGIILTFFLGTTVPAGALASVPIIAWVAGSAVVPAFMSSSVVSSVQIGGGAIIVGIVILCLWNIFVNVDASKVIKIKGGGNNTDLKLSENVSLTGGGVKGIRTFLAELTLVIMAMMYIECKLGQPLYSLTIQFITAIPRMLEQLAGVLF